VFALCHPLGYRFAPRMRDLQDHRLAIIGSAAGYKTLKPILGRPIRIDLIQEN
jgi:TnpA family transposase